MLAAPKEVFSCYSSFLMMSLSSMKSGASFVLLGSFRASTFPFLFVKLYRHLCPYASVYLRSLREVHFFSVVDIQPLISN